jgi:hypothetical protein
MASRGRPPILDPVKRREILAILSVGCSRATAADYVGCSVSTIQKTAERDPAFAEELRRAESRAEIALLQAIQRAAKKEQYWRAAAWALERTKPELFAPRRPHAITQRQLEKFLQALVDLLVDSLPERSRKQFLKRLERLLVSLGLPPKFPPTMERSAKKQSPSDPPR